MYLDSPPDTAGTYQGVSLKIPATLLQLTAEQFAARSGRERIAGACGGQFLRHRRRRKGALLRSRTTIRLREVPESFDGLEASLLAIPGQFLRHFGGPERCGVALTVRISCF
jgi:hypothetical protein